MASALRWDGSIEAAASVADLRARGVEPLLALAPDDVVTDFVLEAQAAALGLAHTTAPPDITPAADARRGLELGLRAVVVAAADQDALGRILALGDPAPWRTLAFAGGPFRRRVDLVAGDVVPWRDGWRLEIGLRGC